MLTTVRYFIVLMMLTIVLLVLLMALNFLSSYYTNKIRPEEEKISTDIAHSIGNNNYNASQYELYRRMKPGFKPLDVALSLAYVAIIIAIFIYNEERT